MVRLRHCPAILIGWPILCLVASATANETVAQDLGADRDTLRPNILLILSDDQGYDDVGCYGSEIPTPHLDSLARDGLKLTQFYAASSICTPSRYGLLTGRNAHRSRDRLTSALMFLADGDRDRGIRAEEQTFVALLASTGYRTHLIGKWHLGHGDRDFLPTRHGFDSFFGHTGGCVDFFTLKYANRPDWFDDEALQQPDGYATDVITDRTLALIRRLQANRAEDFDEPWYIQVAYNAPHFGKAWDEDRLTPVNKMQPKATDLQRVRSIADPLRRAFAAKVVGMDEGIGRLLDCLRESDIEGDTLVIFMTDHGGDPEYGGSNEPLRGGKATLFEGGIRVPCLIRWSGVIEPGRTSDAIASGLDWFPTLIRLAGIESLPSGLDGESILPVLLDQTVPAHRPIVWQTGAHAELNRERWRAVRDGRWKWVDPPGRTPLLFDLDNDPGERRDVASRFPETAARLASLAP